jgi:hypothetical protein
MVHCRTPRRTQTKKRGFKTKRDTAEFAATVEVEKMTGRYVSPVCWPHYGGRFRHQQRDRRNVKCSGQCHEVVHVPAVPVLDAAQPQFRNSLPLRDEVYRDAR